MDAAARLSLRPDHRPEEAVRRAVSTIFGNPITLDRAGTKLWVPTKYDPETIKSVANKLLRQALTPEASESDETGTDAIKASPGAGMASFGAYMRGGRMRIITGGVGDAIREPETTVDEDGQWYELVDIDLWKDEARNIKPVAEKNIFPPTSNAPRFRAGVGPKALGPIGRFNPRAEHEPLHFHLVLPDGREARFLADTFKVFPGDERKATKDHYKEIRHLNEDQRWYITRATRDIYETGSISPKTRSEFGQRILRKIGPRGDDD